MQRVDDAAKSCGADERVGTGKVVQMYHSLEDDSSDGCDGRWWQGGALLTPIGKQFF